MVNPGLYYMDIRDLSGRLEDLEKKLPPFRLQKMQAYRKPEDRMRCLAGWFLMVHFLGRDRKLDESSLSYGPHGKPSLLQGPYFNLSHSGNYVLLALDTFSVGVDVEVWRPESYRKLANACFHPKEIGQMEEDCSAKTFFDLWVLKESYVKMLGCGLSMDLASFCLQRKGRRACLEPDSGSGPFFRLYHCLPECSAAICSNHDNWPNSMIRLHWDTQQGGYV